MALHGLADQPRAWYYSNNAQGFDVNRDFNPDLDYVPHKPRPMKIQYALSNSFGFGGTNGTLLMKRFEDHP